MAGTFTQLYTHAVFSTKNRQNDLTPKIRTEVYAYICGIVQNQEGQVISIGGTLDHVHILFSMAPKISVSEMLKNIKGSSSMWLNKQTFNCPKFKWQAGFGAFTVSYSQLDSVKQYIENQEEHHKKYSFKDEFRVLLKKHNIRFDEEYIWE